MNLGILKSEDYPRHFRAIAVLQSLMRYVIDHACIALLQTLHAIGYQCYCYSDRCALLCHPHVRRGV